MQVDVIVLAYDLTAFDSLLLAICRPRFTLFLLRCTELPGRSFEVKRVKHVVRYGTRNRKAHIIFKHLKCTLIVKMLSAVPNL
jgi:hypothetical protein